MEKQQIVMQQFQALTAGIEATKARLFRIVCLALFGVPVLTYVAEKPGVDFVGPILPFVILALNILYVSEQHALMRASRYVRERIEPLIEEGAGWEAWLESQPGLRLMDKCIFWCVVLVFFFFYFASVGLAIAKLPAGADEFVSGETRVWAGSVIYALGAIWMAITVWHHWRSHGTSSR